MTALKLIDFSPLYCDVEYTRQILADARTATACKIPGCECTEYVPEQYIYPFKHCVRTGVCNHTENSHGKEDEPQQTKKPKRVRR